MYTIWVKWVKQENLQQCCINGNSMHLESEENVTIYAGISDGNSALPTAQGNFLPWSVCSPQNHKSPGKTRSYKYREFANIIPRRRLSLAAANLFSKPTSATALAAARNWTRPRNSEVQKIGLVNCLKFSSYHYQHNHKLCASSIHQETKVRRSWSIS